MGSYGFTEDDIFVHAKSFATKNSASLNLGADSELMVKAQPSQRKPGSWEAIESKLFVGEKEAEARPTAQEGSKGAVQFSLPTNSPLLTSTVLEAQVGTRHPSVHKQHQGERFCPLLLITGRPGVGKTTVLRRVHDRLRDRSTSSLTSKQNPTTDLFGFITNEVRDPKGSGQRIGFKLSFFNAPGMRSPPDITMAHIDFPKSVSVGKYGVDVSAVDSAAKYLCDQVELRYPTPRKGIVAKSEATKSAATEMSSLSAKDPSASTELPMHRTVVLLDEIGKMECLSRGFVHTLQSMLYREQWYSPEGREASLATPAALPPIVVATIAEKGGGLISELKSRAGVKLVEVTESERELLPQTLVDWIDSQ